MRSAGQVFFRDPNPAAGLMGCVDQYEELPKLRSWRGCICRPDFLPDADYQYNKA